MRNYRVEEDRLVSLMGYFHGRRVGLLDVLGLPDGGLDGRLDSPELGMADKELVGAFGTLDLRVGSRNVVEDLGDVFSQARL